MSIRSSILSFINKVKAIPEGIKDSVTVYYYETLCPAWEQALKPMAVLLFFTFAGIIIIETTFVLWLASLEFPFHELPVLPLWASGILCVGGLYVAFRCLDKAYDI